MVGASLRRLFCEEQMSGKFLQFLQSATMIGRQHVADAIQLHLQHAAHELRGGRGKEGKRGKDGRTPTQHTHSEMSRSRRPYGSSRSACKPSELRIPSWLDCENARGAHFAAKTDTGTNVSNRGVSAADSESLRMSVRRESVAATGGSADPPVLLTRWSTAAFTSSTTFCS